MNQADTIYALSSGRPPAAIAVIRISGPDAHSLGERLCGDLPPARHAAVRRISSSTGDLLDMALVLRSDGPASATGEDIVELHCHGGRAVIAAVLAELSRHEGLREARPGEFTRRAFENGRMDLTQAEGLADLLEAETESQRKAALAVTGGAIRRQVDAWRADLLMLSALAEAAIDYAEEDEEAGEKLDFLTSSANRLGARIEEWLRRPRAEALRNGIRVVLAGPPNTGKSSLLNSLVGVDRAIVSPEEGTTRDVIEVPLSLGGQPFLFIDTAGIREPATGIEQIGIGLAQQQIAAADILLWLGDAQEAPAHGNLIGIHSRADLPHRQHPPIGYLAVSTISGLGIDELVRQLVTKASLLLPVAEHVPLNGRQADALRDVADSLGSVTNSSHELTAEALRYARSALDRVTGRSGVEEVLDVLFGRFCLGK